MKTLYLCGPINGCSDEECKGWREQVKQRLGDRFEILDPMDRDYRGEEDSNYLALVRHDYWDINSSDIVLAMANRPSWGTAMEIHHASNRGRVVALVCGQVRISPWLRFHSNLIFADLEQAIAYLEKAA